MIIPSKKNDVTGRRRGVEVWGLNKGLDRVNQLIKNMDDLALMFTTLLDKSVIPKVAIETDNVIRYNYHKDMPEYHITNPRLKECYFEVVGGNNMYIDAHKAKTVQEDPGFKPSLSIDDLNLSLVKIAKSIQYQTEFLKCVSINIDMAVRDVCSGSDKVYYYRVKNKVMAMMKARNHEDFTSGCITPHFFDSTTFSRRVCNALDSNAFRVLHEIKRVEQGR